MYRVLLTVKPIFRIRVLNSIVAGDVALSVSEWYLSTTNPDGSTSIDSGRSYDVNRRQVDGTWLIVIDNPFGMLLPTPQ
jgi:ketosteroid isomerase-like protein